MGHALDAHKTRARTITASNTSTKCATVTVTGEDSGGSTPGNGGTGNGGTGDGGTGDGDIGTPDPPGDDSDGGGFVSDNAALLGGLAVAAVALGAGR